MFNSCTNTQKDNKVKVQLPSSKKSILDEVLMDTLKLYMQIENSKTDILPSELIYCIAFEKDEQKAAFEILLSVSNVEPEIIDSSAQLVGYFKFNDSRIFIIDKVPPVAMRMYNREKLNKQTQSKTKEAPGSGYVGDEKIITLP